MRFELAAAILCLSLAFTDAVAIDGYGNAWLAGGSVVDKLLPSGVLASTSGYTPGGLSEANGIAIDGLGNAWMTSPGPTSQTPAVVKISNSGTNLSGSSGFTTGGFANPRGIAIDGAGTAWVASSLSTQGTTINTVVRFSQNGTVLSGTSGFSGGGLNNPQAVAIDGAGTAWFCNYGVYPSGVTPVTSAGNFPSTVALGPSFDPLSVAIDASGDVWTASNYAGTGV